MSKKIIDPTSNSRYILEGDIVTMDNKYNIIKNGYIIIDGGLIKAILKQGETIPAEFKNYSIKKTRGTIYPGLIELHNHLSYNVLPLWNVPKKFSNRNQWGKIPDYRKLISGPMQILGRTPGYVEALVRFVEAKCLLGGTTTSQGIALFSNNGIRKYYRGIVRNVEQTEEPELPEALSKISDVEANDANKFLNRLKKSKCLLLHLSEGTDSNAHEHFEALQLAKDNWAITDSLAGIHSVALTKDDFKIMKKFKGSIVWSPLSNLLLYGDTTNIKSAKDSGILIGIGSDWSPSGSKNLLGELKIAKLYSENNGKIFSDREILSMATINAAKILKWDKSLGSLQIGKKADLLVINGTSEYPYKKFLESSEKSIHLVVINGVPRYGSLSLMKEFGNGTETWKINGSKRMLNLEQESADPIVGKITLAEARKKLKDGLKELHQLAENLDKNKSFSAPLFTASSKTEWFLVLDHNELEGESQRPHLRSKKSGKNTAELSVPLETVPLSDIIEPIELDTLTVIEDKNYLNNISSQQNLPTYIKEGIKKLYEN